MERKEVDLSNISPLVWILITYDLAGSYVHWSLNIGTGVLQFVHARAADAGVPTLTKKAQNYRQICKSGKLRVCVKLVETPLTSDVLYEC